MANSDSVAFHEKQIFMAHGAGGEASRRLVEGLFRPLFSNPSLDALSDAAILPELSGRLAMTVAGSLKSPAGP